MLSRVLCILATSLAALAAGCAQVQQADAKPRSDGDRISYPCRIAAEPPAIDGSLDDPAWQDAPFSTDFINHRQEAPGLSPTLRTRAKLLYDDANLYVAIVCGDDDIWGTFDRRDDLVFLEEAAVVYLDPLSSGRDYYGSCVNPLNALFDLKRPSGTLDMTRRQGLECAAWNAEGFESAVSVDGTINKRSDQDTGWTVEMKIPFAALGMRPHPGDTWRMQVGRFDRPPSGGLVVSSWTGAIILHDPHRFGVLLFR